MRREKVARESRSQAGRRPSSAKALTPDELTQEGMRLFFLSLFRLSPDVLFDGEFTKVGHA
jgi:hypothetical protein